MTQTLLHICCAPCSIRCIETLRNEGVEPVGFWYNPNIHPYTEYRARRQTLETYAASIGMTLIQNKEYGLRHFLDAVGGDYDNRCEVCYRLRMDETAKQAADRGFASFTTTLLISPYQNHELLVTVAKEAADRYGVEFLYRDFRPTFREGQQIAREQELYMQKYCGCIFSEEDRYRKRKPSAKSSD